MILCLTPSDFLAYIFSPEPDYFNPFTGMYRMDPSSDYEAQVYFFNRIRYTFIHANRRIVCYNQTIYDDMRLEVSEYFGLKLYVEEYYTTFPTEVQPMYDEVAIQILDNDSKQYILYPLST